MPSRRATQKDVAALAGVHTSTVCLALQNHPAISRETRERICKIADKLGYRPDPMLSALASYRSSLRPPAFQGQIAWLAVNTPEVHWSTVPVNYAYMKGAAARAAQRGYALTECNIGYGGLTIRRAVSVLHARNVRGLLICPLGEVHGSIDFPWEKFSAVAFGYSLRTPTLHVVSFDHFHSTRVIFGKLAGLGYKRIGLALPRDLDERTSGFILAAFLRDQLELPASRRIPVLSAGARPSRAEFERWIKRWKPDALITTNYTFPQFLEDLRIKVPDDMGVAVLFRKTGGDHFAGVEQGAHHIGEVAMDYLVAMIQRNERDVPNAPQQVLVAGQWVVGDTVRRIG